MKPFTLLKFFTLPTVLLLALLQSCGGGTSTVTSVPAESTIEQSGINAVATSCTAGQMTFPATDADPETKQLGEATFVKVTKTDGVSFYAATEASSLLPMDPAICGEEEVSLIYLGDPTDVTFDDYVLVRALSSLPPSQRTPENIATVASELYSSRPDGPYNAADLDPVPDGQNTNYARGGSVPAPDLLDAVVVYAASLLSDADRTIPNLVATINAVFPGANITADDILVVPASLPGGLPLNRPLVPTSAGSIQVSVQVENFAAESFTIGAAEFVKLPPPAQSFPGFTTYVARVDSSLIEAGNTQIDIPGLMLDTCVVIHKAGEPPTRQASQLAITDGCEPFDAGFELQSDPTAFLSTDPIDFTVQVLHAADQEAGVAAVEDAPRFSQVIEALADEFSNTLRVTSGDLWIPGPFYNVTGGVADVQINNHLGWQAAVLGNHEFDFGPGTLGGLIGDSDDGTDFPYLSANIDFSNEGSLSGLTVAGGLEASTIPRSIAPSTVITVDGEEFGVVGATTPRLPEISTAGNVIVSPSGATDIPGLAAIVQAEVDALTATGIDKVLVLAHLQQIQNEIQLAGLLRDVDIIVAGGSDTLLANPGDRIRTEFGKDPSGVYPLLFNSATNEPVAVVNTDREYRYVGRLIAGFDSNGLLANIGIESRPYPADDQGVAETGNAPADPTVVAEVEAVEDVLLTVDGTFFGSTDVFLNGERQDVRTQETNLGNLTADANLAAAQATDSSTVVSFKNGGGIRASIGAVLPGDEGLRVPPLANPLTGKQEGQISQLDIQNALRFNNGLTLLTVSPQELKDLIEHGVANIGGGQTIQVGGLSFSYDPNGTPIVFNGDGTVATPGTRVQSVALIDADGEVTDVIVENGVVAPGAPSNIRLVTLNFLANVRSDENPGLGGDGYPFPAFGENKVELFVGDDTTFEAMGREQQALANFLTNLGAPFDEADVAPEQDTRIQNLSVRTDTVLP